MLRLLELDPKINQREIASAAGESLGKTNFCVNVLLGKELIKVQNFKNNKCKLTYALLLTPLGITEIAQLPQRFFKRKMEDHEVLKAEIELLKQ